MQGQIALSTLPQTFLPLCLSQQTAAFDGRRSQSPETSPEMIVRGRIPKIEVDTEHRTIFRFLMDQVMAMAMAMSIASQY